jgi:hypothetical protein
MGTAVGRQARYVASCFFGLFLIGVKLVDMGGFSRKVEQMSSGDLRG